MKPLIKPLLFLCLFYGSASLKAENACWIDPLNANPNQAFNPDSIRNIRNVDQLPGILGPLRNHWTAAYHSESIQNQDVRVVAYAPEAQAIVAYTGCPETRNGQPAAYPAEPYPDCERVEVMRFKSPGEEIELMDYQLPGRNFPNMPVRVNGPNPQECRRCHGNPPQARFEPYNSWPGFFGSRSREGEDVMLQGSPEHRRYESFVNRIFSNPDQFRRYTGLTWRRNEPTAPQNLNEEQRNFFQRIGQIPVRVSHSGNPEPNAELNTMLSDWRGRQLLKRLVDSPEYPKIRFAIQSIALSCNMIEGHRGEFPITRFLPPSLRTSNYQALVDRINRQEPVQANGTRDAVAEENPLSNAPESRYRAVRNGYTNHDQVTQLAYIWQALGRGFAYWNTGIDQRWNFNDGRQGLGPMFDALHQYNNRCQRDLASDLRPDPEGYYGALPNVDGDARLARCRELAERGAATDQTPTPSATGPLPRHSPEVTPPAENH